MRGQTLPHDDTLTSPLIAAPRHLRRRRFHSEIPDTLLVPDAEPLAWELDEAAGPNASMRKRAETPLQGTQSPSRRRKRLVALWCVTIVSLSVPALVVALIVFG